MGTAMTFRLLGPVSILDAGGAPLPSGSPRRQAVLAALVIHRGAVLPVDTLIDMLWAGPAPPTAATMVHGAVAGIRKVLGDGLLATRNRGYVLDVAHDRVDAERFERLLAEGRGFLGSSPSRASQVAGEALALWRGPALAGVDADFARAAAARLDALRLECAELRVEAELGRGRHREVLGELQTLAAQHPLRERLCAQLMLALYRCGLQAEALAAYRSLRRTLAAELGLEPGPELRRLELAVLRQDEDLEWRPSHGRRTLTALPHPMGAFIGRVAGQDDVAALLEAHRLVTLTGPGGAGKTRLALEVARALTARVEVVFVDLTPLTGPDLVDETVAEALGVRGEPGRPLAPTIAAALAARDTVIVLDNCEHLLEACATLVHTVLAVVGRLRLLATSREPLGVPGEQLYPVRPLRVAAELDDWRQISTCEAVQLFASRAASANPGFTVTADNAGLVLDVCRRLDGLPLALELAAARAASMPLPVLAERLKDRFRVLDAVARSRDPRHRCLSATVAWSYELLSASERTAFTRVAVFPASFTLAAAEAVAGPDLRGGDVALLLARLVVCSVVQFEDPDGSRYRLLETTREYARQHVSDDDVPVLRERHTRHYLQQAERVAAHLLSAGSQPWLARLHAERAHLRAALEWSFGPGGEPGVGVRLVRCLWHYWDLRGLRSEGLRWVDAALSTVGPNAAADRLTLLSAGALLHLGRAEFAATETLAREQVELARTVAARGWEGDGLGMLATVAWARGRFDRAQQSYEDAIVASLDGDDLWRAAMEEAQLARLHRDRNEPDAARAVALRSLAHADAVGEELARGLALDVLASLEHRWGDAAQARRLVERALAHYRIVGYREGEASALHLAGQIALAAHDRAAARTAFERALRLCRRIGHRAGTAAALEGLAECGDAAAGVLAGEAAALRAEIGVPRRD